MNKILGFLSKNKAFVGISTCFFVIYSLLSLVNHYNFRTTAWDLGIFNQAIYQYAHFQFSPNTVMNMPNMLADHFEIVMILVSPFFYLFGSYTLLIFQIAMAMFGATGVYLFLNQRTKDQLLSLGGVLIFYSFYGLFAAILYDYHNNTIGIMFLPWILLSLEKNSKKYYYTSLALMILSKENFCVIALFLGLYIALFEKKEWRKHGVTTMFIGFLSLEMIISVAIPYFNNYQPYQHWVYGQIGSSPTSAIQTIIQRPLSSLSILFNNEIKLNSLGMLGASGGFLAILNPLAALLFIPILASKNFSSTPAHWGYFFQYSVEFAPILGISIPLVLNKVPIFKYYILAFFVATNLIISTRATYNDDKRFFDIFKKDFYYNSKTRDLKNAILQIPPGAAVSAENTLVPHLANRKIIFQFPIINNVDYVIINHNPVFHYNSKDLKEYRENIELLKKQSSYHLYFKINDIEIYKK